MTPYPNAALIASIVSEASRASILTVLMDGRMHPASELAYMAKIKPQTASFHLAKMVEANIIVMEKHGRHRYYGIRNQEVAQVMESLLSISPSAPIQSLKQASEDQAVRQARTCYDHLAGKLGVLLTESLINKGIIVENGSEFLLTEHGKQFLTAFQIDLQEVQKKRRAFARSCLDWSERRPHLAGAIGRALLDRLLKLCWIERVPQTRAIKVTSEGMLGFKESFDLDLQTIIHPASVAGKKE